MIGDRGYTPQKILLLLFSASLIFILMLWYVFETGYNMSAKYAPLSDASMEIKLEATKAHLWMEEILSGDSTVKIEKVQSHIDRSRWYAKVMLEGGENHEGVFIPLEDHSMIISVQNVLNALDEFEKITYERYNAISSSGPGTQLDIKYDDVFYKLLKDADFVEHKLHVLIKNDLSTFKLLKVALISLSLLFMIALFFILIRYEKQRMHVTSELIRLSNTDGLTGIANKRFFELEFDKEFHRALRDKEPISILMIDIDFFKAFNDTYGHVAGDECLKLVAATIQTLINRPTDLFARYGGEEFVVLLPNTTDIKHIAERILKSIPELDIPHESSKIADILTISIGGYHTVPTDQMLPSDIIHKADLALYKAKDSGRNQVVIES